MNLTKADLVAQLREYGNRSVEGRLMSAAADALEGVAVDAWNPNLRPGLFCRTPSMLWVLAPDEQSYRGEDNDLIAGLYAQYEPKNLVRTNTGIAFDLTHADRSPMRMTLEYVDQINRAEVPQRTT